MTRKTARNAEKVVDGNRKLRCLSNHRARTARGFINRTEERGHDKEAEKAKVIQRRGFRPIFPLPTV